MSTNSNYRANPSDSPGQQITEPSWAGPDSADAPSASSANNSNSSWTHVLPYDGGEHKIDTGGDFDGDLQYGYPGRHGEMIQLDQHNPSPPDLPPRSNTPDFHVEGKHSPDGGPSEWNQTVSEVGNVGATIDQLDGDVNDCRVAGSTLPRDAAPTAGNYFETEFEHRRNSSYASDFKNRPLNNCTNKNSASSGGGSPLHKVGDSSPSQRSVSSPPARRPNDGFPMDDDRHTESQGRKSVLSDSSSNVQSPPSGTVNYLRKWEEEHEAELAAQRAEVARLKVEAQKTAMGELAKWKELREREISDKVALHRANEERRRKAFVDGKFQSGCVDENGNNMNNSKDGLWSEVWRLIENTADRPGQKDTSFLKSLIRNLKDEEENV